ncbi:MAG: hypothetical protein ACT4P5_11570 [Armatimonadota bacterium]
MAIDVSHLSSFYSYRYFVPPTRIVIDPAPQALEQQVRAKVAEGDAAFAERRYTEALADYLEAYGLLHSYFHPDFPIGAVVANPRLLDNVNIFQPLVIAAVQTARYRQRAGSLPVAAPVDPPPELLKVVDRFATGGKPPMNAAELAYSAATSYLQMGAVEQASKFLARAQALNASPGAARNPVLSANILAALGAVETARGNVQVADRHLKLARAQYAELNMRTAQAAVDNNTGVLFTLMGDARRAGEAFQTAGDLVPEGLGRTLVQNLNPGTASAMTRPMGSAGLAMLVPTSEGKWTAVQSAPEPMEAAQILRVQVGQGVATVSLAQGAETRLIQTVYQPRVNANTLASLYPHLQVDANLIAYLPHTYGFVLPMDIGDCYAALGRRPEAVDYYLKALDYQFLNRHIEAPRVWLKAARAVVEEADLHFRRGDTGTARDWYERVLRSDGTAPAGSRLYQGAHFAPMIGAVQGVVAAMDGGPAFAGNLEVAALIAYVRAQLAKIAAALNWLGLADDVVPIWTFDFLQSTARYFAQHAIQAWREYISFRAAAEQAEMTEREMEQAVTMNWFALQAQRAQQELADRQRDVAQALRDGAGLHRDNLVAQRDQFNADGWVIAELNRFQAWYSNANADQVFGSGHWDWGGGRELSIGETTAQQAIDAVIDYRNRISHQMHIDNFNRQIAEANNQITVANRQLDVANAQRNVARWQTWAAERQLDFAQENLSFFRQQEFTPDMWHALADRLRGVANRYLEMGIYAAFLMERAYAVENDRDLRRIRFDYASPGVGELTAGDSLLLDVDSFSHDLLVHSAGKRNRVRHVISLSDFAPQAFTGFVRTGVMEFTVPLYAIERVYPGTHLHRIQSVEVEIEGLQVPEGITGTLAHLGISSWRSADGSVRSRVTAPEAMILSGFRLRRDLVLYRADPMRLGLFENSGVAASWRLELPMATNDVDFATISDVRLVLYFYCLHDRDLEATIRATFPANDEAAQSFSARLHAPDEFFAFGAPPDGSNTMTFSLNPRVFPYNQLNRASTRVGIQVLRNSASGRAEPFPNVALTVSMAGQSGSGTTDANGVLSSDGALAPLLNRPLGDVRVEFTGAPQDRSDVNDVFVLLNYRFDYR